MLNKYTVGIDYEEPLGVYYAEDEKAAISECKQDHLFQYGKRLTHKLCRAVGSASAPNLIAVLHRG
jgi:hypothetical protein